MPKKLISIQLPQKEWDALRDRAKKHRRSIKGQAEWELLAALVACVPVQPQPDIDPENIDDDPPANTPDPTRATVENWK